MILNMKYVYVSLMCGKFVYLERKKHSEGSRIESAPTFELFDSGLSG